MSSPNLKCSQSPPPYDQTSSNTASSSNSFDFSSCNLFTFQENEFHPLRECCQVLATLNGYSASRILEEFRRFMLIKALTKDSDATIVSPTPLMDSVWHAAILNTKYYEMVQKHFGLTIHHVPNTGNSPQDCEAKSNRLDEMTRKYRMLWNRDPLCEFSQNASNQSDQSNQSQDSKQSGQSVVSASTNKTNSHISIFFKLTNGQTFTLNVDSSATLASLKLRLESLVGLRSSQYRLFFDNGWLTCDNFPVSFCGLTHGCEVYVVELTEIDQDGKHVMNQSNQSNQSEKNNSLLNAVSDQTVSDTQKDKEKSKALISVCFKDLNGRDYTLQVEPSATVASIKLRLEHLFGFSSCQQRLFFREKWLSDDQTVTESGLTNLCEVRMVPRLTGC